MKGLAGYIHAAAIVSLGTLALWAVKDLWPPLAVLAVAAGLFVLGPGRKKK